MSEDLSNLPPEEFFQLAVERGGLDLEEVIQGLSREAGAALLSITAYSPDSELRSFDLIRSGPTRGVSSLTPLRKKPVCGACGRVNRRRDNFCRSCGRRLDEVVPPPKTLDALVSQGRLTTEQADEVKEKLLFLQSHYTAGTRYSVFGKAP
jgi:hypothetical protein